VVSSRKVVGVGVCILAVTVANYVAIAFPLLSPFPLPLFLPLALLVAYCLPPCHHCQRVWVTGQWQVAAGEDSWWR
jgi:hypothetical protein